MVLSHTDENELLTALHAGVFDSPPWGLFLERLRARADADRCRIRIRPAGAGNWVELQAVAARTAGAGALSGLDDAAPFGDLRPGRVYAGPELGDGVAPFGRYMRVVSPDAGEVAVSMVRLTSDFSGRDSSLLSGLAPHIAIALRTLIGLGRERRRGDVAAFAHGRLGLGWLLLDDRGRLLEQDAMAAAMLDAGRTLRRAADGRLRLPYVEADSLLQAVLGDPSMLRHGPRAAWADVDPPVQIILLTPTLTSAPGLPPPAVLALLRPLLREAPRDGRLLADLFRLSRKEAALAHRIAAGDSIAEAAEALDLTLETARNYSKRIYGKIGARGQADLVRILLSGVTGLG